MSNETYDNSGALFVNDRKQQPNHPDRQGHITIGGKKYKLSGWLKPGRDGRPQWCSLSVSPWEDNRSSGRSDAHHPPHQDPPPPPARDTTMPF